MRRIAWVLLLLFAFAIPWEYSLDLGEPLGNIARVVGLLLLLVAIPAVLQAGRMRTPGSDAVAGAGASISGSAAPISGPSSRWRRWPGCAATSRR